MDVKTARDKRYTTETGEYQAIAQVRERFTAILLELQANQIILHELVNCYKMFRFTGGKVPTGRWWLDALTSHIEQPLTTDRISTDEAVRYRDLAVAIMALGQAVAAGKPRTLRARRDIVNTFNKAAAEIQASQRALESGLTMLLDELGASSDFSQWLHVFASGQSGFSTIDERGEIAHFQNQ